MVLSMIPTINADKLSTFLGVVLNSSMHLQSVIEDALDISRLENNKFTLYKEIFDIRNAVNEVCEIMKFQLNQKNLGLEMNISDKVPLKIYSDVKRYKQVIFNLMGNAIKFTYEGKIKVNLDLDEDNLLLITDVEDTGMGI